MCLILVPLAALAQEQIRRGIEPIHNTDPSPEYIKGHRNEFEESDIEYYKRLPGYEFLFYEKREKIGFKDIGTLPGDNASFAHAVNNNGHVVGISGQGVSGLDGSNDVFDYIEYKPLLKGLSGFLYDGKNLIDLGENVIPRNINNKGAIVGYIRSGSGLENAFFMPRPGMLKILPLPKGYEGARALDINEKRQIVGLVYRIEKRNDPVDGPYEVIIYKAVMWEKGLVKLLPAPPQEDSIARAINNNGFIVGNVRKAETETTPVVYTPLVWKNGVQKRVTSLRSRIGAAEVINDEGVIAGFFEEDEDYCLFFIYEDKAFRNLGHVDPINSSNTSCKVEALNNSGDILLEQNLLWTSGKFISLHELLEDAPSIWSVTRAADINDGGHVVGVFHDRQSDFLPHAFIFQLPNP